MPGIRPLVLVVLIVTVLLPTGVASASHVEASAITLSDTAVGSTSTYTVSYQIGGGNGSLAAGQPKLRLTFPATSDVAGATFDALASGICDCPGGSVAGTFTAFPAFAGGGSVVIDAANRTITIGPLDVATTDGRTAFRVVIDGVVNRTTSGSTSLGLQVLNAADGTNTNGSVSFTLTGASAVTGAASSVARTTATLAGTANAPGGLDITRRGIVVATTASPTVGGEGVTTIEASTAGTGAFSVSATGLTAETTYVYRAFAETVEGLVYGLDGTFTTTAVEPEVPTTPNTAPSAPTTRLTCAPEPVAPGGVLTCTMTGGVPGFDVLWRVTLGGQVIEGVVVAGDDGTAQFSLLVPRSSTDDGSLSVELVDWTRPVVVSVSDGAGASSLGDAGGTVSTVPSSIPTGGGPRPAAAVLLNAVLVAVLIAVMAFGSAGPVVETYRGAGLPALDLQALRRPAARVTMPAIDVAPALDMPAFDALEARLQQLRAAVHAVGHDTSGDMPRRGSAA
jgi:hypothetical protein